VGPNFKNPVRRSSTQLEVEGSFDTHGEVIGNVMIGFLIIPEDNTEALTEPITGIVTLTNDQLTTRTPDANDDGVKITSGEFVKADVSNAFDLREGAKVRVIGLAVAVKAGEPAVGGSGPPDAPAFQTYTWCVDRTVVGP
jgi:hypothetical protein